MRLIDADHLRRWILSRVFKTQLSVADVIDQIDREDTIEPERKPGRWTHAWGSDDGIWRCSECGFEIDAHGCVDPVEYLETYKFCPNCGSDNREDIPMEYFESGGT